MRRQESHKGFWPRAPCPADYEFQQGKCKLILLKTCRHHIDGLKCCLPEESLCSLPSHSSLSFPGQFVKIQYVIALGSDKQELFDCRLETSENRNFKINRGRYRYVIEAEVKPNGCMHLAETTAVDCSGNPLPSYAGKFTFLLPANIPTIFGITVKLKSVGAALRHCGTWELLDELHTHIVTHYAPKNLCDYQDGHFLPTVELPFAKKQIVGILGTPEGQQTFQYFQNLVENGAYDCFKRDQLRLIQHTTTSSASEAFYKDLLLAVQLEESLLLYQMGKLDESKKVSEDVCIQAYNDNSPNYNAIAGRAKCVLSSTYKMEENFDKAEELLDYSAELLEAVVPGEDSSINRTCLAALYSEKAAVTGITKLEKKKLKKAMKDAMLHYRHQLDKNLNRNARGPRRTLIRAAFYYLHASREQPTNMQMAVSEEDLAKVETFVQQFRSVFLASCPLRDKALFYSAHGDLLTRKGQLEEGISLVSEALRIAEELQLQPDIQGTCDRLQQLNMLRLEQGEIGQRPCEMAEETMMPPRFQEPPREILERHLEKLTRVSRCRS